jgi:PAS domain S-box-containing protein
VSRTGPRDLCVDDTAIVQRNAFLAAIVHSAQDAIIATDANGMIVSWNAGARRHFDFAAKEMIGRPIGHFIPPDRQREEARALACLWAGEAAAPYASVRRNRAGQALAVSVALSPVRDEAAHIVAVAAIIRPLDSAAHAGKPVGGPGSDTARESEAGTTPAGLWSHLLAEPDSPAPRNILVVEDETLDSLGLAAMLGNAGFDVLGPVGDLGEALAKLDAHDCALAILDLKLPSGTTLEPLARRLRRDKIPFFVLSAAAQAAPVAALARARSLARPVGARSLVSIVHEMLG